MSRPPWEFVGEAYLPLASGSDIPLTDQCQVASIIKSVFRRKRTPVPNNGGQRFRETMETCSNPRC